MILVRSLLYLVFLYGSMIVLGLISLPAVVLHGRAAASRAARRWGSGAILGARVICGIDYELRGLERLPAGPVLIASKHQAMWETLFFLKLLEAPAIVLKKELLSLPVYGWYARKLELIPVDRSRGASALKDMTREALNASAEGRSIVIFPEGTRQPPGAPPDYKPGIAMLYRRLGLPCVPVALNSGLYWAGQGILRRPGRILVEILEPIPPGLDRESFMSELTTRVEAASKRLLQEAEAHSKTGQKVPATA